MRQVMNISLPPEMLLELQKEAKAEKFSSLSEYIRHVIRERKREKLIAEILEEREKILSGKIKLTKRLPL